MTVSVDFILILAGGISLSYLVYQVCDLFIAWVLKQEEK